MEIAEFASQTFGFPPARSRGLRLGLPGRRSCRREADGDPPRAALVQRGNGCFVAFSDPTNRTTYDEIKFQTGLLVDPVVVEDGKLGTLIAKVLKSNDVSLSSLGRGHRRRTDRGAAGAGTGFLGIDIDDAPVVSTSRRSFWTPSTAALGHPLRAYERYYRCAIAPTASCTRWRSRRSRSRRRSPRASR